MPFTVKIPPSVIAQTQAAIIPDASTRNYGVMTPTQARFLRDFARSFSPVSLVTDDAIIHTAAAIAMPDDGVQTSILNVTAANADGTDWAFWLLAAAVIVRSLGVVTVITPGGLQAPAVQAGPTSATWRIQVVSSVDEYLLQFQGAAGVTVKWSALPFSNYNVNVP